MKKGIKWQVQSLINRKKDRLNNSFKDIEYKINNNKSNLTIVDICIIAAKILYKALINTTEELEDKNLDELKIFFDEESQKENDEEKKEIPKAFNYALSISK